jgi:hypothetical protein
MIDDGEYSNDLLRIWIESMMAFGVTAPAFGCSESKTKKSLRMVVVR